jgi:hypothetical protein
MDREPDVALGGESTELLTTLLLPGKAIDEGQFQSAVALFDQLVEELLITQIFGWEPGDAKADTAHEWEGIDGIERRARAHACHMLKP